MTRSVRCKARAKQTGEQCRRYAAPGREVCAIHGGKSLAGIAHPSLKSGRYSKHLPSRLIETYQRSVEDAELLALREDIALVDSRITDVLSRVDTGESGSLWRRVGEAWRSFSKARSAGDEDAESDAIWEMSQLIETGVQDAAAWDELLKLVERRRRLVDSERRRLVDMELMMTAEQAMVLVAAVSDAVRRHVSDPSVLARISEDITRVVAAGAR